MWVELITIRDGWWTSDVFHCFLNKNFHLYLFFCFLYKQMKKKDSNECLLCRVVIEADSPHIKMVCEQLDRCHGSLLQYVEFLCGAMTPITSYAQLVPDLHDLIHSYHLEPEVSFYFCSLYSHLFAYQGVLLKKIYPFITLYFQLLSY